MDKLSSLLPMLDNTSWVSRSSACRTLGNSGDIRAVEPLVQRLKDSNDHVRYWAYKALIKLIPTCQMQKLRIKEVLCRSCLMRFSYYPKRIKHKRFLNEPTIDVLVCRRCKKSTAAIPAIKQLIAVLDKNMSSKLLCEEQTARGNWLKFGKLFDFDSVEIISATDKQVERFCIAVGNDTDPFRQDYKKMVCLIKCELSENTMRILRNMFRKVKKFNER